MKLKMTKIFAVFLVAFLNQNEVRSEDLSHLPMEHRGGDIRLGPPQALPQTSFLNSKRQAVADPDDIWPAVTPDLPQIQDIQVQCQKTSIRINIKFDRPFYGMVFSKGFYSDPNCVHLAPGSGTITASFEIFLSQCGMTSSGNTQNNGQPNPAGSYVENTIIIQYDPLVQEVWDQARKLRCTWYDYYEKSVTFRPFQVDMMNAVTANFLGDNLQCWMQIQVGKGPWSSEVSGIVKIGQTMTMVLGIKDDENKFDMLVRNCVAHDGKRAPIQLVDELGCVTRPKIMSKFQKIKNFGSSATVVSYAYFQAFKFPDSMNVHFQCVIQVCRFNCPDPICDGETANFGPQGTPSLSSYSGPQSTLDAFNNANQRSFRVDPRNPSRPAGQVMDEELLDQMRAPQQSQAAYRLPPPLGARRLALEALKGQPPMDDGSATETDRSYGLQGLQRKLGELMSGKQRQDDMKQPMLKRIYKREAQEMADIETSSVIQVLSPGDVAFTLGAGNDSTVVLNSSEWDEDNICLSMTSLVGGLVMLLGVLFVASLVASCLHCSNKKKKKLLG